MAAVTRREWLQAAALGAASLALGAEATGRPKMHDYKSYGWLRGFSVVPSWGARIEEAWWAYDGDRFRWEIAPARQLGANCLRLWIEFTAWMADPDKVTAHFVDAVAAIAAAGMKAMPCLFNRWHDNRFDYGGCYTEDLYRDWAPKLDYVKALVQPLAADPRVLVWDLCNEPQAFDLGAEWAQKEYGFLRQVRDTVRAAGAQQPITIGTMTGGNIDTYAPLCDVLCGHPYCHQEADLVAAIAALTAQQARHAKPLLVNECIPGCLDDQRRAAVAKFTAERLSAAGFGWMGWALREGKAISTRRDRYDGNGLDQQGFHPFVTHDGRPRGGLEFMEQPPAVAAPWVAA